MNCNHPWPISYTFDPNHTNYAIYLPDIAGCCLVTSIVSRGNIAGDLTAWCEPENFHLDFLYSRLTANQVGETFQNLISKVGEVVSCPTQKLARFIYTNWNYLIPAANQTLQIEGHYQPCSQVSAPTYQEEANTNRTVNVSKIFTFPTETSKSVYPSSFQRDAHLSGFRSLNFNSTEFCQKVKVIHKGDDAGPLYIQCFETPNYMPWAQYDSPTQAYYCKKLTNRNFSQMRVTHDYPNRDVTIAADTSIQFEHTLLPCSQVSEILNPSLKSNSAILARPNTWLIVALVALACLKVTF